AAGVLARRPDLGFGLPDDHVELPVAEGRDAAGSAARLRADARPDGGGPQPGGRGAQGALMRDPQVSAEELLRRLQEEERRGQRGRLTILLGFAAGVGKTVRMLDEGHRLKAEGRDVVVGYFEPHERPFTRARLGDLEVIPPRMVEYRGTRLPEMDVDAVLTRRPEIALVDE